MRYRKYMVLWIVVVFVIMQIGVLLLEYLKHPDKTYHMIFIPKIIDEKTDFWKLLIEGVEMAAVENQVEVTIVAPESEEDYKAQNQLIEWAISQQPDAILLTPCSYTESTEYVKEIKEQGIVLVLIDSAVDADVADAVVATNNIRIGEAEGTFMKQFVSEDSCIAIVGHVKNSSTAIERELGVRKGLGEYEEKIADVVFCDSDYDKAYAQMMNLLEQYPTIDLVAGLNEYSAVGAARAIKEKGLEKQIKVVGIDSSLEEIQMLEEGIFTAIVMQNPFKMGYMGMEVAVKILNGEKVLKNIDSGCQLITKENMYTEENQKLLFPFREE